MKLDITSIFKVIGKLLSSWKKSKETEIKVEIPKVEVVEPTYEVKNLTNTLKWHKTRKWGKRPLTKITKALVHQSLTTGSLEGINNYHITPGPQNHISEKGAPHICYHYAIEKDGTICQLNALSSLVWHTGGQNTVGIGVVVLGDFDGPSYEGKDKNPTDAQFKAVDYLLHKVIRKQFPDIEIGGHFMYGKENCPGLALQKYVEETNNA